MASAFEFLGMRNLIVVGKILEFIKMSDEFIDSQGSLSQIIYFEMGNSMFIFFTESFSEKASKFRKGDEAERAIHVIVFCDAINDMIGPRASSSFSHIREGKNDSASMR